MKNCIICTVIDGIATGDCYAMVFAIEIFNHIKASEDHYRKGEIRY